MCTILIQSILSASCHFLSRPMVVSHHSPINILATTVLLYCIYSVQCSPVSKCSVTFEPPVAFPPQSVIFLWVFQRLHLYSSPDCQSSPSWRKSLVSLLQRRKKKKYISHLAVDVFTTELQREGDAVVAICCDDIAGTRDGVVK